jgi:two-component system phosphate regulon sensor histidine kinase PhoR
MADLEHAWRSSREEGFVLDDLTGIPLLSSVLGRVEEELRRREQVGFLYFDVVQFDHLRQTYGPATARALLEALGETLKSQRGKLFRDEDLVAVGGRGTDYFVMFLFSPPRRKPRFSEADFKLISYRVVQKLSNILAEKASALGIKEKVDFHSGHTVLAWEEGIPVERLVQEAQKEAALKSKLDEILVTFVSNVTHELRTPLTCIRGYAETLLEGALEDRELTERWLDTIIQEAQRLERLIHDLLDLSMIEAQQIDFRFQPTDVRRLAEHTVQVLLPHGRKAGVSVRTEMEPDIPSVRVDPDRISQVLTNLVDNAIKYSPPQGEVVVRVLNHAGGVAIEVTDHGTGMPDSELSRIFERFYRVEKGRSARHGGRGLGLAIAKHIVEAHGGALTVRSTLGQGSTFRVELPSDVSWLEENSPSEEELE